MATNFPTSLDSYTNPTEYDKTNSATVPLYQVITDLQDAVEAMQAAMGLSGVKEILDVTPFKARLLTVRNSTTDATPTELFTDGAAARLTIPSDASVGFEVLVIGRRTDADNETAMYKFTGVLDNNAGTTALVFGAPMKIGMEDTAAWNAAISADDTNDALVITVTGEGSKSISWLGVVTWAEVNA